MSAVKRCFTPLTQPERSDDYYLVRLREIKDEREAGYLHEADQLERLVRRFEQYSYVQVLDPAGRLLTPEIIRERYSTAKGLDYVIVITANSERVLELRVGIVNSILDRGDY